MNQLTTPLTLENFLSLPETKPASEFINGTIVQKAIEILSPQSQNKVLGKLLHCSQAGTELGWLVDPEDESVLIVFPEQRVQLIKGDRPLPVLPEIELSLTAKQVFDWLAID